MRVAADLRHAGQGTLGHLLSDSLLDDPVQPVGLFELVIGLDHHRGVQ